MQPVLSSISPTSANPFRVDLNFCEYTDSADALDAFAAIVVGNGSTVSGSLTLNSSGMDLFFFWVVPDMDGPVSISIPAGAYTCTTSGGPNEASNTLSVLFDSNPPQPLIDLKSGETNPTNDPFWVTIHFYADVESSDLPGIETALSLGNCEKGTGGIGGWMATGDPMVWDLHIVPLSEGVVTVQLGAGAYADLAGNSSVASNAFSNTYDTTGPSPVISLKPGESDPTNGPFWVTVDFGEDMDSADVLAMDSSAFTWSGCALGTEGVGGWMATGNPQVYELQVVPTDEGVITVQMNAAVYTDVAGNDNVASNVFDAVYDITPPVPVISLRAGESDPTNGPFWVAVNFAVDVDSSVLEGIDDTRFLFTNCQRGTGGINGWSPTSDPQIFEFHVKPIAEGSVSLRMKSGAYQDVAGNGSTLSNLFTNVYDITPPTPTIVLKSGEPNPVSEAFWVTIDFFEDIDGADLDTIAGAVSWTNCTKGDAGVGGWQATGSPQVFDLQVVPSSPGIVSVQLGAGAYTDPAGNASDASNPFSIGCDVPAAGRDVVIMMDISASMNWPVDIGAEEKPKIDFMRPAVHQFIDEWAAFVNNGDRFGLVVFESLASKLTDTLQNFDAAQLHALIDSITPKGNTAMGPALGLGLLDLLLANQSNETYGRARDAILFADGQDNISPLVTTTADSFFVDAVNHGGYPHELGPLTVTAGNPDNIPVHTIGIGETSSWLEKLNHLSSVSGGIEKATATSQIWPGMINGLQDVLTAVYSDSSPQVVFRKQARLANLGKAGDKREDSFVLNSSVKKILVSVSWIGDTPLKLTLRKNGRRILEFDKITRRDDQRYLIAELKLPHFRQRLSGQLKDRVLSVLKKRTTVADTYVEVLRREGCRSLVTIDKTVEESTTVMDLHGRAIPRSCFTSVLGYTLSAKGSWDVTVERVDGGGKGPVDYNLSVIADEKAVACSVEQPSSVYTGKPFDVCLRVREKSGKPVLRVYSAEVRVSRPRNAAANVLKKYQTQSSKVARNDKRLLSSLLSARVATLHRNKKAVSELTQIVVERIILKPPKGNARTQGVFCGTYRRAKVPGTYHLQYRVRGISRDAGMFEHVIERTLLVKPRVSRRYTEILKKAASNKRTLEWTLTPKDVYGNLIGPGYAEVIKAEFVSGKSLKIVDNLDGTYLISVSKRVVDKEKKAVVRVRVFNRTMYIGKLSKMKL